MSASPGSCRPAPLTSECQGRHTSSQRLLSNLQEDPGHFHLIKASARVRCGACLCLGSRGKGSRSVSVSSPCLQEQRQTEGTGGEWCPKHGNQDPGFYRQLLHELSLQGLKRSFKVPRLKPESS